MQAIICLINWGSSQSDNICLEVLYLLTMEACPISYQMGPVPARAATCLVVHGSAYESSMEALKQPTVRVVAIIAEGVPEADSKQLIAFARAHNKIIIGPATVGGLQVRGSWRLLPSLL